MKISKEFKIGAVVICAIAAFIWGLNFLKGYDILSRKNVLYAVYPQIDGLIEANPLMVKGYKIGQVNQITLMKKGGEYQVLVKFLITEDVKIPKHSVAKAVSSDLLGSKAVEIIYSNETEFVQSGDTLLAASEEDLKTAVDKRLTPLQKKAEGLLSSIDSVMVIVETVLNANTRDNLSKSFESIKKALTSLEQTSYKLDDLVASEKAKISSILSKLNTVAGMLEQNTGKIENIITNVSNLSDSLAKAQLKDAIANADKTLKELNVLIAQINSGQGTLGKLAKNDSLYNNLNKASADLDKLMKDLRINPERYIHFSVFGRKEKNKPKD
ncbi:MAG TPA: MlaD family protein [Bacteroidia bacterium]|nr:MCE family protein [Bacteroidia bacterium]HRD38772.1 MlaD family protein [Bacteroidia bacterium]